MTALDTSKIVFPDVMDLRAAAVFLGMSEMRIRALARDGSLKAAKNAETGKWEFKKVDLTAYQNTPRERKAGVRSSANGKAWVVNVTAENLEKVKAALAPFGVTLQPRYNTAAQKEYRIKRQAALKAKAAANPVKVTPPAAPAAAKPAVK